MDEDSTRALGRSLPRVVAGSGDWVARVEAPYGAWLADAGRGGRHGPRLQDLPLARGNVVNRPMVGLRHDFVLDDERVPHWRIAA